MLFHMEEDAQGRLSGWVLPDNPSATPALRVSLPDARTIEIAPNTLRPDLQDRSLHDNGMAGFSLGADTHPDLFPLPDAAEVRDVETNVLLYRRFQSETHRPEKLLRFDIRAMPDPQIEQLFASHFALVYGTAQRYPQDTFFGIFNNPTARSIYISGRPNMQQYEQVLRERGYKMIALLRDPYEEMAERLLFARYAASPNQPPFIADHIFGLEPLMEAVRDLRFDDPDSITAAFGAMNEAQKRALTNPLVQTLACMPDELPKTRHIEIALSKLSRMNLVGVRERFDDFKSILPEVVGVDVLGDYAPANVTWVQRLAADLRRIKQARALIALDLDLYSFVDEALTEAIGPAPAAVA